MTENQAIEYKQSWHDDYLRWICGFANSSGGTLWIGVNDDGSVSGIDDCKRLMVEIPNKSRDLMGVTVSLNENQENGKYFIEIGIPSYTIPVSLRGRYYFRSGSTNLELTGNSLNEFLMRKFGKTWDDAVEDSFTFDDVNLGTIEEFKKLATDRLPSIASETDPLLILNKLNLLKDGKFKRAAVLLFGKNPQRFFMQSHIKIGRFVSDSDILTSDIVEGNLFQQIEQTLSILKTKYLLSPITYEGIHRREKLEYPYNALREAIINAIIHRNYLTTSAVQIRIYDDKLIIMNEGILPDEIKIEDLKRNHLSKPRNTLLADIFYKSGFIESWGRGTLKIVNECVNENLPEPDFENRGHLFALIFYKTEITDKSSEKSSEKGSEKSSEKIINLINSNQEITIEGLAKQLGLSTRAVEKQIASLKKKNLIKRIGPAKGGYWEVMEKEKES